MIFLYKLFFPAVFLFFLPGLIVKLIRRPGRKANYAERFGCFSKERKAALGQMRGAVWIHAVSVGETNAALSFLKKWTAREPSRRFVFTTTTTTAQEIAREKVPAGVEVFFAPVDFLPFVRKFLRLARPSALIVFETELWPNMILESVKSGAKAFLVNARLSDRSIRGYLRFKGFFAPVLNAFTAICAQTELDRERYCAVAPDANALVTGNIKFDQCPPAELKAAELGDIFPGNAVKVLAASTHAPEEKTVIEAFSEAKKKVPQLRLILVPRHAERGGEIETLLRESGLTWHRRTSKKTPGQCDVLLADTTGELLGFYKAADIVLMGKTFCGNDEGQNIIEPAHLGKAIITGAKMKNFRQAFNALKDGAGVSALESDSLLADAVGKLASDAEARNRLGANAKNAVSKHAGALLKTITILEENL